jgi:hypothetical protein
LQDQVYAALAVQEQVAQLGSILLLMLKLLLLHQDTWMRLIDELAIRRRGDYVLTSTTPPTAFITYVKTRASAVVALAGDWHKSSSYSVVK